MITSMECPSCEITVLDIHNEEITERVKKLHIGAVPAVVIDGKLSSCCINKGPKLETLRAEGIGVPL
jgi:hypothetical protein